jgi:hypothetical protein
MVARSTDVELYLRSAKRATQTFLKGMVQDVVSCFHSPQDVRPLIGSIDRVRKRGYAFYPKLEWYEKETPLQRLY